MQDGARTEGTLKMTQGLQVYDANGNIILDVTDRITKYLGAILINQTDGSITDARVNEGDLWYLYLYARSHQSGMTNGTYYNYGPTLTKGDGVINYAYPSSASSNEKMTVYVLYGVY
nr:MAG TPA: hypothetical protein [Bacteriophage sp.]